MYITLLAATVQVYYTCEECNRAWSGVTAGKNPPVRLCEPCVLRCHRGHKGVRKVREAKVSCICETMCIAIQCMCNARKIDQAQLQIQQFGFEERIEWKRREDRDRLNPLVGYWFTPCFIIIIIILYFKHLISLNINQSYLFFFFFFFFKYNTF
jgi:hypothetical protein